MADDLLVDGDDPKNREKVLDSLSGETLPARPIREVMDGCDAVGSQITGGIPSFDPAPQSGGGRHVRLSIQQNIENDVQIEQQGQAHLYFSFR